VAEVIVIDGALGEGGGQILRTSLSLSLLTGRPVRLVRIRANRPKPGLAAQHLAAVTAAARISGARVAGAEPGSLDLYFEPQEVRPTELSLDIGTAGSTSLVLQTVAVPLALADGPSRVSLTGGTHVPWSPTIDFLRSDWVPAMRQMGLELKVRLNRSGYYPAGGGEVFSRVSGGGRPRSITRKVRGNLRSVHGRVFLSRLARAIGERAAREARRQLRRAGVAVRVDLEERESAGPGMGIHLEAVMQDESRVGFSSLGQKGKAAERVAREAANALIDWLDTGAGTAMHLSDQLLLPLSLADGPSVVATSRITRHLVTNAEVIRRFLPTRIAIEGGEGHPGEVRIEPAP
jgi:RNA 3'-terminal phosphate cyclase (ATP)